jgi:hypothetical protein
MAKKINKITRNSKGKDVQDPSSIQSLIYNLQVGAQKNMDMGHHLIPIFTGGSYTTNVTTATAIPRRGITLAVYNNSGSVGSITLGMDNSIAALAVGATDTNGNVGIACKPNDWTYIATYDKHFVRASASTLIVYVVEDDSYIISQSYDNTP